MAPIKVQAPLRQVPHFNSSRSPAEGGLAGAGRELGESLQDRQDPEPQPPRGGGGGRPKALAGNHRHCGSKGTGPSEYTANGWPSFLAKPVSGPLAVDTPLLPDPRCPAALL